MTSWWLVKCPTFNMQLVTEKSWNLGSAPRESLDGVKKGDTACDDLWDDFGFNLFLSAFTWRDFDALFDLIMFKENKVTISSLIDWSPVTFESLSNHPLPSHEQGLIVSNAVSAWLWSFVQAQSAGVHQFDHKTSRIYAEACEKLDTVVIMIMFSKSTTSEAFPRRILLLNHFSPDSHRVHDQESALPRPSLNPGKEPVCHATGHLLIVKRPCLSSP